MFKFHKMYFHSWKSYTSTENQERVYNKKEQKNILGRTFDFI